MKSKNIQGGARLRIEGLRDSLKSAERRLADYILKHPDQVIHMTIQELEKGSGASYATIIRFCKKSGFSGFKSLKNSLIQDVIKQSPAPISSGGFPIEEKDDVRTIVNKTFQSSLQILEETRRILDEEALAKAIKKIVNAGEVVFIGTGTSGITARYAFTRFFRIGIRCSAETDSTLLKIKSSILTEKDVLFAVSSSGRSRCIIDAARHAKKQKAAVISLCDYAISPLSRLASVQLYTTPRNVAQFMDTEMPLFVAQIHLIDILFFSACLALGKSAFDRFQLTKSVADAEKESV